MTLQQITTRAKQIRKKNPGKKWVLCIKQASKELKSKAPAKKKAPAKRKPAKKVVRRRRVGSAKVVKIKKPKNRQTGRSSKLHDERFAALPPGKRLSRSNVVYYERRKNRSDKPGSLSGTGLPGLMSLVKLSQNNFERLKKELKEAQAKQKAAKDRFSKMIFKTRADRLKYEIRERKQVLTSLASQIKALSKKK